MTRDHCSGSAAYTLKYDVIRNLTSLPERENGG